MSYKPHFDVTATYQTAAILKAAATALSELTNGGSTRAHSFEALVQQYVGKRYSLEEIRNVLSKPISDYIVKIEGL